METKIFQEDQEKLVAPFFPISSLHVPVTSNNFLRCGLPTNHEDHYKQTSNSPKLQLFFTHLLSQELKALPLFCLTRQLSTLFKGCFLLRIHKFLCMIVLYVSKSTFTPSSHPDRTISKTLEKRILQTLKGCKRLSHWCITWTSARPHSQIPELHRLTFPDLKDKMMFLVFFPMDT